MQFKNYIATFFVLIFLGKMITMDAKILMVLFDYSEVTLVNKLCPKKQIQADSTEEFATATFNHTFEFDHLCHVAFDIRLNEVPEALTKNNFRKYNYRTPADFSINGDKFYPPPRA